MKHAYTVYIEPGTGAEYRILPDPWQGRVSPLTPDNCAGFGWTTAEREEEITAPVPVYSKLRLVRAMKEAGIWADVENAIEGAGLWDEFVLAQDLSAGDPVFAPFLDTLVQAYGKEMVDGILERSRLE